MGSIETARTHQGVTEGAQREGVYAIFLCVPSIHQLAPCEAGLRVTMGDLSISHCALQDSDRHVFSSGTYVGELSPRMSVAPVL